MLYGFSGDPGTGKSLNAIKFIIENDDFADRPVFYHGINIMLLDFDVCKSFEGWLYGVYYPQNMDNKAFKKKLFTIQKEQRLASLDDFPYLNYLYKQHDPVALWLSWFKKVASKKRLSLFNEALAVLDKKEEDLTEFEIKDLGLSWTQFHDPTLVHQLPSGSVILIDEVQNIWPARAGKKELTPDLEFVTKHRHSANDLVYISQHFKDVDPVITRRISFFTYYQFYGKDLLIPFSNNNYFDIDSKMDLSKFKGDKFKRDKAFYGLYLSAIEHTQKVKFSPVLIKNLKLGAFFIVLLFVLIYATYQSALFAPIRAQVSGKELDDIKQVSTFTASSSSSVPIASGLDLYLNKFAPRHDVMTFSAPAFDHLTTTANTYPKLTCVLKSSDSCTCFTQQLTKYSLSFSACKAISLHGFFDPFHNESGRKMNNDISLEGTLN